MKVANQTRRLGVMESAEDFDRGAAHIGQRMIQLVQEGTTDEFLQGGDTIELARTDARGAAQAVGSAA